MATTCLLGSYPAILCRPRLVYRLLLRISHFHATRGDPLQIFAFMVAHLIVLVVLVGFIIPKSLNVFVPPERRDEGNRQYAPMTVLGKDDTNVVGGVAPGQEYEAGLPPAYDTDKAADKK